MQVARQLTSQLTCAENNRPPEVNWQLFAVNMFKKESS